MAGHTLHLEPGRTRDTVGPGIIRAIRETAPTAMHLLAELSRTPPLSMGEWLVCIGSTAPGERLQFARYQPRQLMSSADPSIPAGCPHPAVVTLIWDGAAVGGVEPHPDFDTHSVLLVWGPDSSHSSTREAATELARLLRAEVAWVRS